MSKILTRKLKNSDLKMQSKSLNKKIIALTKTIVDHYEHAYRVVIKDFGSSQAYGKIKYQQIVLAKFKFIEEAFEPFSDQEALENLSTKIYFTGVSGDIHFVNTVINQEAKIQNIIRLKKHATKQIKCYGQFCEYTKDSEESKKIESISDINKNMFRNQFYDVFGSLIKRAHQNVELVSKIIANHKIKHKDFDPDFRQKQVVQAYDPDQSIRRFALMIPSDIPELKIHPLEEDRIFKVCTNCYRVYSLLTDYFNEIEDINKLVVKQKYNRNKRFGSINTSLNTDK